MSDAHKLLFTRGVRGLADGVVSIVLATYLTGLGFGPVAVGAIITVLRLATLFSVDSFGGGFVVQSLLVLWLSRRFEEGVR